MPHAATEHAGDAGERRKQNALRDELTHNARAARAEGRADAELARTRGRSGEQQVADVGARDQQHHDDDAGDQGQRRADVADHLIEDAIDRNAFVLVRPGVRAFELRRDRVHLRLRLIERDAGLQAADRPVVVPRSRRRWRDHPPRRPHVGAGWEAELGRQDADDRVDALGVFQRAPEGRAVPAEPRRPERVADDGGERAALLLLGVGGETAGCRACPEQREELRRDACHHGVVRAAADADRGLATRVRGHAVEARRAVVPVLEIGGGHRAADARRAPERGQRDQTVLVRIGQRAEQHRVDHAEDRRVRADPERQDERRNQREGGLIQQEPRGVAQVCEHGGLDEGGLREVAHGSRPTSRSSALKRFQTAAGCVQNPPQRAQPSPVPLILSLSKDGLKAMQFWMYMLSCADGSHFVGHTDDLEKRMAAHDDGTFGAYTARHRPVRLRSRQA